MRRNIPPVPGVIGGPESASAAAASCELSREPSAANYVGTLPRDPWPCVGHSKGLPQGVADSDTCERGWGNPGGAKDGAFQAADAASEQSCVTLVRCPRSGA